MNTLKDIVDDEKSKHYWKLFYMANELRIIQRLLLENSPSHIINLQLNGYVSELMTYTAP